MRDLTALKGPRRPARPSGARRAQTELPPWGDSGRRNLGTLAARERRCNVAALIGTLAATSESGQFSAAFLSTAAILEPVTLLTLLAWCALRRCCRGCRALSRVHAACTGLAVAPLVAAARAATVCWARSAGQRRRVDGRGGGAGRRRGGASITWSCARAPTRPPGRSQLQALQSRIRPHSCSIA